MLEFLRHLFSNDYMPHGHCYYWEPSILIPVVVGDLLTFISYMVIPVVLWRYVKKRNDLRFGLIFKAFAAFIFFCGIGHLIDVVNVWEPFYRISAISKMSTGLVSVGTVIVLLKFFPKALRIPSIAQLDQVNKELQVKNKELQELNEIYGATMKTVRLGHWSLELESEELFWSPVVYEIHEIENGSKVDLESAVDFYHPDYRQKVKDAVAGAINNGESYDLELLLITAKNKEIWVRAIGKAEFENGKAVRIKGLFQDINEQKVRSLKLLERESFLSEAEDLAKLGSYRWYKNGNRHIWSDGKYKILGFELGEVEAKFSSVLDVVEPEDKEKVKSCKDLAVKNDTSYEITYHIRTKDGQKKVLVDKGLPWHTESVAEKGYLGIVRDITDQHKKEEELQELLLSLKRSNSELQSFAYVASHDLQEPLRVITSYLQILEMSYSNTLDEDGREYIANTIKAAARMKSLIVDLLSISRLDTVVFERESVDLNTILDQVKDNLQVAIEESSAVIEYSPLPVVIGDKVRMLRLFQNIISNGIKFKHSERPPVIRIHWVPKGDQYQFKVCDNGIGIKEEYFDRIFTIFQRLHTREDYKGNGIGLAVCKKILESHNSEMKVESEYGEGTCFIFELNKS